MSYQAQPYAESLRQARRDKHWSQRELATKAGMPQTHISKIESGAVDLRLSTLLTLARLLDLELVLTPRSTLLAVQAVIREGQSDYLARATRGLLGQLSSIAGRASEIYPHHSAADRLADLIIEISSIDALPQSVFNLAELQNIVDDLKAGVASPEPDNRRISVAVARLVDLRNALVHGVSSVDKPAYSLNEED